MAMSDPSPGATWQGSEIVSAFLGERETLMPMLAVQEDLVRRLLARHPHTVTRFLDIGSGDGAMSELLLSLKPQAEAVLVDFSEPTLEGAERRLAGGPARWQTVRGDLSDDGDDDRPDSAEDQVRWLLDAGFERAEVHFKWAEAAVFGAIKPAGGER
jgi:trans-aconitate methyltransferase